MNWISRMRIVCRRSLEKCLRAIDYSRAWIRTPPVTAVTSLDNGQASLETDVQSTSEKRSAAGGSGERYSSRVPGPHAIFTYG